MIHRLFISIRLVVSVCDFQPEKNRANLPDDVGTFDWIRTMYVRHKMRNESAASHHNLFNFCQPVIATWTTTVREIFRPIGLALRIVRTLRRQHGAIDETEIERKERKKNKRKIVCWACDYQTTTGSVFTLHTTRRLHHRVART